jgi:hypothetical protein
MTAMTRILIMALTLWLSIEPVLAQSLDGNVDVQGPADAALFVVDSRDPYFEKRSSLKVGAKGEEHIDVSSADVCQAFHHAELRRSTVRADSGKGMHRLRTADRTLVSRAHRARALSRSRLPHRLSRR